MLTKLSAIETVKMFAKDCISNGIPLDEVILFGSYSNNTQKLYSDMDVALVSSIFTGFGPEDIEKIAPIMFRMKAYHDIEPHTYSKNHFQKGDPFIDEIKKRGIKIL